MTLDEMKALPATVPCGTCRACCMSDRVVLRDDEAECYRWHHEAGSKVLDRKSNGECVYLTARGCSVHDAPPDICRRFDCRILFLTTPKWRRRQRVIENPSMRLVYDAGKRRADTLSIRGA